MTYCSTVVTAFLTHWSYHNLALRCAIAIKLRTAVSERLHAGHANANPHRRLVSTWPVIDDGGNWKPIPVNIFVLFHDDTIYIYQSCDNIPMYRVYSGADQRKHQSPASLAFMRGIHRWAVNSPHKVPVTRKIFPVGHVTMKSTIFNERFQIQRI